MHASPRQRFIHRTIVGLFTTLTSTFLLSGCNAQETWDDFAQNFGNSRQTNATPSASAPPTPSSSTSPEATLPPPPTYAPGSTVGDYAQSFPPALFPTPDGAELLATSAQTTPDSEPPTVTVTLNLSSTHSPTQVMDQTTTILTKQGFTAVDAPEKSGLTEQALFLRTTTVNGSPVKESLLIGILDDGKRTLLTLKGAVAITSTKEHVG